MSTTKNIVTTTALCQMKLEPTVWKDNRRVRLEGDLTASQFMELANRLVTEHLEAESKQCQP